MIRYSLEISVGKIHLLETEVDCRVSENPIIEIIDAEEWRRSETQLPYRKSFNHSLDTIRYCKLEKYNNCIQGTMKIPGKENRKTIYFGYYLKESKLIFVGKEEYLKEQIEKIQDNLYENEDLFMFLLVLFENILEEDFFYLQYLEEQVEKMEEDLLKRIPKHFYEIIMLYRKKFSALHAYYQQLMDVGERMQDVMGQRFSAEEDMAWQHYVDRAERFHNNVEMLREYLVQIRELYQSIITERQNKVMSFLTIITTIFFPLTLITGWYGMNFPDMPEFSWEYGYPAVIGISMLILVAEIVYFKKKKML